MDSQTIYFLIGPPSIGKSTYVKNSFDAANTIVISRDDIVQKIAQSYGLTYDDLFAWPPTDSPIGVILPGYEKHGLTMKTSGRFSKMFPVSFSNITDINVEADNKLYSDFNSAISSGKDVVIDMTNMSIFWRKSFINKAEKINPDINKVAVIFNFQDPDTLEILTKVAEKRRIEDLKKGLKKTITPEVFSRVLSSFEAPSASEGFDKIEYVDTLPELRKIANEISENMKLRKYIRAILNEMEIAPDGRILGWDNSEIEMSDKERDKAFMDILKAYGVEDGRIIGSGMKEYWFPIEAKEALELIGISWGYEDKATNRAHDDYGKHFFVVDYNDVTRKY